MDGKKHRLHDKVVTELQELAETIPVLNITVPLKRDTGPLQPPGFETAGTVSGHGNVSIC